MNLIRRHMANRRLSEGQTLASAGRYEEASLTYDRAIALAPRDSRMKLHSALALSGTGRHLEGVSVLDQASAADPTAFVFPLFEGTIWYDAGNLVKARQAFTRARSLDPTNDLVQAYLALTDMAAGPFDDGYSRLRPMISRVYAPFQSRVLLHCEQYLLAHSDRAEPLFLLIAQQQRRASNKGFLAGATDLLDRGLLLAWYSAAKALTRLRLATRSGERQVRILLLRGAERYEVDDVEGARALFQQAAERDPKRDETQVRLAHLHLFSREYDAALACLDDVDEDA